uniref:uncharacterized protein LOC120345790 n=1 Tax=Styela clava TaxID=7725 RepID=UPI00193ADF0F|nr:uncharacterized protein LOC120345790 [Styela clava]
MSNLLNTIPKEKMICRMQRSAKRRCAVSLATGHVKTKTLDFAQAFHHWENSVSFNQGVDATNFCKGSNVQLHSRKLKGSSSTQNISTNVRTSSSRGLSIVSSSALSYLKTTFFILVIHLTLLQAVSFAASHDGEISRLSSTGKSYITVAFSSDEKINKERSYLQQIARLSSQVSKRQTRSVHQCRPEVQQFSNLANHAYQMARLGFEKIFTKRHAFNHLLATRSWEGYCLHTHEQLKEVFCDSHRKAGLFGKHTDDLQASIRSMSILLQQEMNSVKQQYTSWSRASCTHTTNSGYTELRRKILNKLHSIYISVQNYCLADI